MTVRFVNSESGFPVSPNRNEFDLFRFKLIKVQKGFNISKEETFNRKSCDLDFKMSDNQFGINKKLTVRAQELT